MLKQILNVTVPCLLHAVLGCEGEQGYWLHQWYCRTMRPHLQPLVAELHSCHDCLSRIEVLIHLHLYSSLFCSCGYSSTTPPPLPVPLVKLPSRIGTLWLPSGARTRARRLHLGSGWPGRSLLEEAVEPLVAIHW